MGGYGSGYRRGRKPTVEQMQPLAQTAAGFASHLPPAAQAAGQGAITVRYASGRFFVQQTIQLQAVRLGKGGTVQRWYAVCPTCGNRRAILYSQPNGLTCRACLRLGYTSTQSRPAGKSKAAARSALESAHKRLTAYREKLARARAGSKHHTALLGKIAALTARVGGQPIDDRAAAITSPAPPAHHTASAQQIKD